MNTLKLKPKNRSQLRLFLGKTFYTTRRWIEWYTDSKKYAIKKREEILPYTIKAHKTPLIRKLKDVDMWYQYNKIINLKLAVERLNGIVIQPGETFSYWRLIGKPSKRKGYVDGMVLYYGSFKPGVGGGLCQLSNLIYWITLHTPLTVTERHRHSYDVFPDSNRNQPFGSGATCSYNYMDLQIMNQTNHPYQLHLKVTDQYLEGEWLSVEEPLYTYEIYEKEHKISHEYWGAYLRHNLIFRKVFNRQKQLIEDEYITENHALMMYEPFLEQGKSSS